MIKSLKAFFSDGYVLLVLAALIFWATAQVQAPRAAHHNILVATEKAGVPFKGAVVLVMRHDRLGAWGIILNRPARGKNAYADGGPVKKDRIFILHSNDAALPESEMLNDLGLGLAKGALAAAAMKSLDPNPSWSLVSAGYAGWGRQQLDDEIGRGGWKIVPYDKALVTETPPAKLWNMAMKRVNKK